MSILRKYANNEGKTIWVGVKTCSVGDVLAVIGMPTLEQAFKGDEKQSICMGVKNETKGVAMKLRLSPTAVNGLIEKLTDDPMNWLAKKIKIVGIKEYDSTKSGFIYEAV